MALISLLFALLTLNVVGVGIGLLMAGTLLQTAFGLASVALGAVLARMNYLTFRLIEGVWTAEIRLLEDAVYMRLPAWRSIVHRPARFDGLVRYRDIACVERRMESYAGQLQRTSRLVLHEGPAIFLFDEGFAGTQQWARSHQPLIDGLAEAASVPLRDLGTVEGEAMPLMAWAAKPAPWDAEAVDPAWAREVWWRAQFLGALVAAATAVAIIGQVLTR